MVCVAHLHRAWKPEKKRKRPLAIGARAVSRTFVFFHKQNWNLRPGLAVVLLPSSCLALALAGGSC